MPRGRRWLLPSWLLASFDMFMIIFRLLDSTFVLLHHNPCSIIKWTLISESSPRGTLSNTRFSNLGFLQGLYRISWLQTVADVHQDKSRWLAKWSTRYNSRIIPISGLTFYSSTTPRNDIGTISLRFWSSAKNNSKSLDPESNCSLEFIQLRAVMTSFPCMQNMPSFITIALEHSMSHCIRTLFKENASQVLQVHVREIVG